MQYQHKVYQAGVLFWESSPHKWFLLMRCFCVANLEVGNQSEKVGKMSYRGTDLVCGVVAFYVF